MAYNLTSNGSLVGFNTTTVSRGIIDREKLRFNPAQPRIVDQVVIVQTTYTPSTTTANFTMNSSLGGGNITFSGHSVFNNSTNYGPHQLHDGTVSTFDWSNNSSITAGNWFGIWTFPKVIGIEKIFVRPRSSNDNFPTGMTVGIGGSAVASVLQTTYTPVTIVTGDGFTMTSGNYSGTGYYVNLTTLVEGIGTGGNFGTNPQGGFLQAGTAGNYGGGGGGGSNGGNGTAGFPGVGGGGSGGNIYIGNNGTAGINTRPNAPFSTDANYPGNNVGQGGLGSTTVGSGTAAGNGYVWIYNLTTSTATTFSGGVGPYTFNALANNSYRIKMWGAGGGGAAAGSNGNSYGGTGGHTYLDTITPTTNETWTVYIGQGGGNSTGNAGSNNCRYGIGGNGYGQGGNGGGDINQSFTWCGGGGGGSTAVVGNTVGIVMAGGGGGAGGDGGLSGAAMEGNRRIFCNASKMYTKQIYLTWVSGTGCYIGEIVFRGGIFT